MALGFTGRGPAIRKALPRPFTRGLRGPLVHARQGGGPIRPSGRPEPPRDGRSRDGPPPPRKGGDARPPQPLVVPAKEFADWWDRKVFKGAVVGPIQPIQLANGQAVRPGLGTAGRPITVGTNHLLLDVKIQQVLQYEVNMSRLPVGTAGAELDTAGSGGRSPSAGSAGGTVEAGRTAGKASPGGKGAKKPRAVKVTGPEAHAVLSYLLDTTPSGAASEAKSAWVYDGGAALYTVAQNDLVGMAAPGGGDGAGAPERQPDGSVVVEVPRAAGSEAAGGRYKVYLRRTAAMDVQRCLQDLQELRRQRLAAAAGAAATDKSSAAEELEAAEAEAAGDGRVPRVGSEQAVMMVLELVSRAGVAADPDAVRVGSGTYVSYKQEDKGARVAQSGLLPLKVLNGVRSSISLTAAGVTMAIDTTTAVVAEDGPLLAQLQKAFSSDELAKALREKRNTAAVKAALEGLEVKYNESVSNNITYKLTGALTPESAAKTMFKDASGVPTSVASYFRNRYNVTLKFPDLPCALGRKGEALPLELLNVKRAQKRNQKLSDKQKADLIRLTAKPPKERQAAIQEIKSRQLRNLDSPEARAFGLELKSPKEFLKVKGRLLPGPLLEVGNGAGRPPAGLAAGNEGEWRLPRVAQAVDWGSGAVLAYVDQKDEKNVRALEDKLRTSLLQKCGARMALDLPIMLASMPRQGKDLAKDAEDWLRQAARRAKAKFGKEPQLVLVVLPERGGSDFYSAIKAAGDGVLGIPTQCINPVKAKLSQGGPAPSFTDLVAISINAKLGGITTRLAGRPEDWLPSLAGKRLMVLGADLSRGAAAALAGRGASAGGAGAADPAAAPGLEYAAVVGSVDSHCVKFLQQLSAQSSGSRDMVLSMRESVEQLLRSYAADADRGRAVQQQAVRCPVPVEALPEVLLMYRDGVADSMFDAVLAEEYPAIQEACHAVGGPAYKPAITFVVVQKSHNTRLFPAEAAEAHRSGNVKPGTVVEQGVVDDLLFSFFLNSHAGIQGTNRVPEYTVLADSFGFTSDDLTLLTLGLCHTYPACNRALSLPPAARLADRAAERARTAFRDQVSRPSTSTVWYEMLKAPLPANYVL